MALNQTKNGAKVTVLNPYGAGDTSIVLQTGQGAKLPTGTPFNVMWWNSTDYADPSDDPNAEVVRVTNIATDTLTVTRAQEGSTATTKNTSGRTYKMVAGLTAKGPESFQIGSGANASASYPLDVRWGSSQSQIHLTDHDADDGCWILGQSTAGTVLAFSKGAYFNGTNWIAKETQTSIIYISSNAAQALLMFHDTGLTVGNSFSPTEVARFDGTGRLGLVGVGAPNVSLDTAGAISTRFASVTLANGLNSNIAISTSGNIRATGPTGAYSLGGFSGGVDGRELFFFNPLSQTVTIVNGDASSTAANRIQTNTGGNVALRTTAPSCARFKYDSTLSLWILMNSN